MGLGHPVGIVSTPSPRLWEEVTSVARFPPWDAHSKPLPVQPGHRPGTGWGCRWPNWGSQETSVLCSWCVTSLASAGASEMLCLGMQDSCGQEPRCPSEVFPPRCGGAGFRGCSKALCSPNSWLLGKRRGRQRARSRWRRHPGNSRQLRSPPGLEQVHSVPPQICRLRKVGEVQPLPPPFPRPELGSSHFPPRPHRELENQGSQSLGVRQGSGWDQGVQDAKGEREFPRSLCCKSPPS